jgi:hypothetical protein
MTIAKSKKQFRETYHWHVNCLGTLWHSTLAEEDNERLTAALLVCQEIIDKVAETLDLPEVHQ